MVTRRLLPSGEETGSVCATSSLVSEPSPETSAERRAKRARRRQAGEWRSPPSSPILPVSVSRGSDAACAHSNVVPSPKRTRRVVARAPRCHQSYTHARLRATTVRLSARHATRTRALRRREATPHHHLLCVFPCVQRSAPRGSVWCVATRVVALLPSRRTTTTTRMMRDDPMDDGRTVTPHGRPPRPGSLRFLPSGEETGSLCATLSSSRQ